MSQGFQMAQLSVYLKYCRDRTQADNIARSLAERVPSGGRVDLITITDKQYSQIVTIRSSERVQRQNPSNLTLF